MGRKRKNLSDVIDVEKRAAYGALAVLAAERAQLSPATAEAAAENDQAREIRDSLWAEMERRIEDVRTYSVDGIHTWLRDDLGLKVGRGSVQRLRENAVGRMAAIRLRAQRAREVIEAVGSTGQVEALEAARALASQAMFDALANLDAASLANLTASQILKLCDGVANLSRQDIETRYRKAQLGELMKKFDKEAAKKVKSTSGVLNADDLAEIRKAVFGEQ